MSYYRHHLFFCTNSRDDGKQCCANADAEGMRAYAKEQCRERGIHGPEGVRVNIAGCLGRCSEGPVAVVYPEGTWYTYIDQEDIDEIIEGHLIGGVPVERLKLDP